MESIELKKKLIEGESLPEGLSVGGSLDLRGTNITSLPEGLSVGGYLYLRGTNITSLPEGLSVGGSLDLENCSNITSLPEGLSVGGVLYLPNSRLTNIGTYRKLEPSTPEWVEGRFVWADGILTPIKKTIHAENYFFFVGRIPHRNVVSDGVHFAHCDKFVDGIADLKIKLNGQDASRFYSLRYDTRLTPEEAIEAYRVITGACAQGTRLFLDKIGNEANKTHTVREIIELVGTNYGFADFARFIKKNEEEDR